MPNIIKASQYAGIEQTVIFSAPPAAVSRSNAVEERKKILDEAAEEAKKILETAQSYSAKLIQENTQRMEEESKKTRIRSQEAGYHEGFEKGLQKGSEEGFEAGCLQGMQEAKESQRRLLDSMSDLLRNMEEQKAEILERFSSDIEKLAFEIARKIVRSELSANPKAIAAIIANATEAYKNQAWIKVTVSQDMEQWFTDEGILAALHEVSDNVKVAVSPSMESGGCLIDMPDRMIDAGLETQLSRVKSALQL